MTLDEAIKRAEEVVEENQRIVDAGIVFDDVTVDMLYCDDTEVIDEHLANYQKCASEHSQLAEWLKDYKRLLERESCEDAISRKEVIDTIYRECSCENLDIDFAKVLLLQRKIKALPPVTPQSKIGYCKDCKWQKDSDGIFRRGIDAESQCPMNRIEVYEGTGYCYMFKPKESEMQE